MLTIMMLLILFLSVLSSEFKEFHQRMKATSSIFYLGDSTSEKVYLNGLVHVLNCHHKDPNVIVHVEPSIQNGLICYPPNTARGVMRIGYMRHWGVSREDKDYFYWFAAMKARESTSTNNSVVNILNAVEEFKQRSSDDTDVTFILLSSLWDGYRYKYNYPNVPSEDWLMQYQHNYTALVAEIMIRLRPGKDTLVLQTQHSIHTHHKVSTTVDPINTKIVEAAKFFEIPVFDEYEIVRDYSGGNFSKSLGSDEIHQTNDCSYLLAQHIVERNWTVHGFCSH